MSKATRWQRLQRAGQPYTRVSPDQKYEQIELTQDGEIKQGLTIVDCMAVRGYTLEYRQPNEDDAEWELYWEEHDLGQQPTLEEANKTAADWRESLRGVYELRR